MAVCGAPRCLIETNWPLPLCRPHWNHVPFLLRSAYWSAYHYWKLNRQDEGANLALNRARQRIYDSFVTPKGTAGTRRP